MTLFLFVLTLWSAESTRDHRPAHVPPLYAVAVYLAAHHHGIDVWDAASLLTAENQNRAYDPGQRGRYGANPREVGLFQLVPEFAAEARERCSFIGKRYRELTTPCLFIASGSGVHLEDPWQNIEAAMIAFAYLQARRSETIRRAPEWTPYVPRQWQAMFRCHKRAWNRPRLSKRCGWSVARVLRWRADLVAHHSHLKEEAPP